MKNGWMWLFGWGLLLGGSTVSLGASVQLQAPLSSVGDATQETGLGDVIADAVRESGGADVALVAADEITETTIPAGSQSDDRFVRALRYADDSSDTVTILSLTGAQLKRVVERSVSRTPEAFDGFFQVSGLSFHFDGSRPDGSRVTEIAVGGDPVQDGKAYRVATTRPVADGSFGYFRLWNPSDIVEDTHTSIAAAVTHSLADHRTLNAPSNDRITP